MPVIFHYAFSKGRDYSCDISCGGNEMGIGISVQKLLCFAIFIILGSFPQSSVAQTMQQLRTCQSNSVDPDAKIRACSVFIDTRHAVGGRPIPLKGLQGVTELRGIGYMKKNDLPHALADFQAVVRLNPQLGEAYRLRGVIYMNMKDYDHAVSDFNEALRLSPKDPYAKTGLQTIAMTRKINSQWERYLQEIQNDGDYANWSGPPLEVFRNEK
ncbi:MAG TPA: tetratricopeptide repeat protein [Bradyrhizobium sp.]